MTFFCKRVFIGFTTSLLFSIFAFGSNPLGNNVHVIESGSVKYLSNMIVVKLDEQPFANPDGSVQLSQTLKDFIDGYGFVSADLLFPNKTFYDDSGFNRLVIINYNLDADPNFVSSKISKLNGIEWAEPKFVYELSYTPNDPSFGSQWNLSIIDAGLAWDVTKGDTNVVIGIVDTGVDWDHPDLAANIWMNRDEIAGNGIDDDDNGYVDDIRGWDFGGLHGTPDNNPMEDRPDHGTHVAGISSAVTDNGTGIASIGFNSKIMAVKTTIDDQRGANGPFVLFGFEGIIYAADNGAKVINCSWGGGGFSIFGQETINYAVSKGALVVCAAGNSSSPDPHYPSAYNGALSVASTTSSDHISGFSNYGTTVDVSSPGSGIYSTWMNNTYTTLSGTSMASPLAAGLAALVWSQFPTYTAMQIGEQLRVNSDNIDGINPSYTNLLGFGRINANNAVTNSSSVSVRAVGFTFSDEAPGGNGDGIIDPGETITLAVSFVNYLNPTSNLLITLENKNSYSTVDNGTFSAGARVMLEEFDNNTNKFVFTVSASLPQNADLKFLLHYNDGSYDDYQWAGTIGNPSYATQFGNDIAMTITSKGTFAYNDYPNNGQGDGFTYLGGDNLLFEGSLILGTSASKISDGARGADQNNQNTDFSIVQPFILDIPGEFADIEGTSIFNDNGAAGNKIGIETHLNSYTFTSAGDEKYIILDYRFINTNSSNVNNLFAGLFFDWDFADAVGDISGWDNAGGFGYVYRDGGAPDNYVGVGLISSEDFGFWAILNGGGDGGFQIYDGFDDSEKWTAISSGLGKLDAGTGDVSHVVSAGPYNISAGDTLRVAFAVMGADDLSGLQLAVANARTKFNYIVTSIDNETGDDNLPNVFALEQNYPNPFNPSTKIKYSIPPNLPDGKAGVKRERSNVSLIIYDILGTEIATLVNEEKSAGTYEVEFSAKGGSASGGDVYSLPSGIYFYTLRSGSFIQTRKMIVLK